MAKVLHLYNHLRSCVHTLFHFNVSFEDCTTFFMSEINLFINAHTYTARRVSFKSWTGGEKKKKKVHTHTLI